MSSNPTDKDTFQIRPDADIKSIVADAIATAARKRSTYFFSHRGVGVQVSPHSNANIIVRDWRRALAGCIPRVLPHPNLTLSDKERANDRQTAGALGRDDTFLNPQVVQLDRQFTGQEIMDAVRLTSDSLCESNYVEERVLKIDGIDYFMVGRWSMWTAMNIAIAVDQGKGLTLLVAKGKPCNSVLVTRKGWSNSVYATAHNDGNNYGVNRRYADLLQGTLLWEEG